MGMKVAISEGCRKAKPPEEAVSKEVRDTSRQESEGVPLILSLIPQEWGIQGVD